MTVVTDPKERICTLCTIVNILIGKKAARTAMAILIKIQPMIRCTPRRSKPKVKPFINCEAISSKVLSINENTNVNTIPLKAAFDATEICLLLFTFCIALNIA
jgi:hypothetical protein